MGRSSPHAHTEPSRQSTRTASRIVHTIGHCVFTLAAAIAGRDGAADAHVLSPPLVAERPGLVQRVPQLAVASTWTKERDREREYSVNCHVA